MVTIRELSHLVDQLEGNAAAQIVDFVFLDAVLTRSVLSRKTCYAPCAAQGKRIEAVGVERILQRALSRAGPSFRATGSASTEVMARWHLEDPGS